MAHKSSKNMTTPSTSAETMAFSFRQFTKQFAWPLWPWYVLGALSLALTNYISLTIPLLAKVITNAFHDNFKAEHLENQALLIVALGILTIIIRTLSRAFIFWPGRKLEANAKSYLFNRLLHARYTFFQRFGMGELISRIANDVGILRAFYAFGVLQFLNLTFLLIFAVAQMLQIHTLLTMASLGPICIMIFFMKFMMNLMHKISLANQKAVGRLTNRVTEAFVNVHVIQANVAEEAFLKRIDKENQAVYETNVQSLFIRTVLFPLMTTLMNISQIVVVFYGGYLVIHNMLTIGDLLAFNVYIAYLGFPLSAFGIIISLLQRSKAALERLQTIAEAEQEKTYPPQECQDNRQAAPDSSLRILQVHHLKYRYEHLPTEPSGKNKVSLQNAEPFQLGPISFELDSQQKLGIFGRIGSGKTTLLNLITRLIDPPAGQVFFHGQDILSWDPCKLRQHIAYAEQKPQLFSDSIRNNLKLGVHPEPSDEQLREAARKAEILAEIESFPQGWETPIGEKGLRLSGGQKQRLALARLFLRQPEIFLLDDVLSAVDQQTEQRLIQNIIATQAALVIVSHRVSVLKKCDHILILDQGQIIDQGTYYDLVHRHPHLKEDQEESADS